MCEFELMIEKIESEDAIVFSEINKIALKNQKKVLDAFRNHAVSARHFVPTNGYGYDDQGREMLAKLFCDVFHAESAIVSPLIVNGTHAITLALFGILRPGDVMLSVTGSPYDTLDEVINGGGGSLKDFGVSYCQTEYREGSVDFEAVSSIMREKKPKLVFLQRSKGYLWQEAMSVSKIGEAVSFIKSIAPESIVLVDNCYGEFTEEIEPSDVGADIVVGSLIKNAGGGVAPTGGYILGKELYIELIAKRMTAPSLGSEVGSYASSYLPFFQGLFLAPSTVKNAMSGTYLASKMLGSMGYETLPSGRSVPGDIICAIKFESERKLVSFCQSVQELSPVDSNVTPYPWDMPGYADKVIMAAGTFVQGGSLELTADGPIKPPYIGYLQGGLTYEHIKIALIDICKRLTYC